MKAIIGGASALVLFMAMLCMGVVAFFFGGDDSTCTSTTGTATAGFAPSVAPSLNTPPSIRTSDMTWDSEQVHNAATIISVAIHMGVPVRGWIIALAAAMQESNLVNLPDLGDANNADSLGLFQERPSQGWGTPDQIMDPVYSSTKFFEHLLAVQGWQTMTVTQAAQAVERSAFPDAYAKWEPDATQLVAAITGLADPSGAVPVLCAGGGGGGPVSLPSGFSLPPGTPPAAATAIMWALGQLGTPYSLGGDCTAAHSGNPAHQCDCSSLVQQAYQAAGISLPRTSQAQFRAGVPVSGPDQLQPGDLIFVPGAPPGTIDAPGHVGIYIGSGLVVAAPQAGDVVHITNLSPYWTGGLAGIRRV
jgi:cell wall-associated NlpC family hydrolase